MVKIPLLNLGAAPQVPAQPFIQAETAQFEVLEQLGQQLGQMAEEKQRLNDNSESMKLFTDATVELAEAEKGFTTAGLGAQEKTAQLRTVSKEIFERQSNASSNQNVQVAFENSFSQHTRSRLIQRIGEEAAEFSAEKKAEIDTALPKMIDNCARTRTPEEADACVKGGIAWLESFDSVLSPEQLRKRKAILETDVRTIRLKSQILLDPIAGLVQIDQTEGLTLEEELPLISLAQQELVRRDNDTRRADAKADREQRLASEATEKQLLLATQAGQDIETLLADPDVNRRMTPDALRRVKQDSLNLQRGTAEVSNDGTLIVFRSAINGAETPDQIDALISNISLARGENELSRAHVQSLLTAAFNRRDRIRTRVRSVRDIAVSSGRAFIQRFLTVSGPAATLAPEQAVIAAASLEYDRLTAEGGPLEDEDPQLVALEIVQRSIQSLAVAQGITKEKFIQGLRFRTVTEVDVAVKNRLLSEEQADFFYGMIEVAETMKGMEDPTGTPEAPAAKKKVRKPTTPRRR